MQNKIDTSDLAARLAIQKQYNATLHSDLSHPLGGYSRQLSKQLAEYAELDASVSSILRDIIYIALQSEHEKKGKEIGEFMAAHTMLQPVVFAPIESKEVETTALAALRVAQVIETHASKMLQATAQSAAGQEISDIVDLNALAVVSTRRANALSRIIKSINDGSFWTRPEAVTWACLQCGTAINAKQAFENCPCCHAGREFASA